MNDVEMTGARALVASLLDSGVQVCFANPGTSEMHFVAALDAFPQMRAVLCLFEGVATGAADGYGRMTGRPAATLLHLGPGLANGIANLHNARRAGTPLLNIVGDHAAGHKQLDSPLDSDIDSLAGTVSSWLRRSASAGEVGTDAVAAVAATLSSGDTDPDSTDRTGTSGAIATLVVPADVSWSAGGRPGPPLPSARAAVVSDEAVASVAHALKSAEPVVILLDGAALTEPAVREASRIERATGARVFCPTWPSRLRSGAGIPQVRRLGYREEDVAAQLRGTRHLVLAGSREPVTSFGYPGRNGLLTPPGARVHRLAGPGEDVAYALARLAELVADGAQPVLAAPRSSPISAGLLTADNWAQVIGVLLPEEAIVCDESITSGMATLPDALAGAPAHDYLGLTGLSIGQGLPLAAGAAIACPQRPVICLEADGSAMYTISALWTQAREQLDITTVVLNNRSYAILRAELERVGASPTGAATQLMDLSQPDLDFVALATGMGVPATRATTTQQLHAQFRTALSEPGPHLIEAVLQPRG
jgi:acetolactate synthase I/II/III large subunit